VRLGDQQLAALEELHRLLERHRIEYWLFGGWAVDFHAGTVTRAHDDLDLAVWLEDYDRIVALHTPLREGRGAWPDEAFADDVAELGGTRARIISLGALRADKSEGSRRPARGREGPRRPREPQAGGMFWLMRKKLSGSTFRFRARRRSYFSAP
jgi:hypothetical protein